MDGKHAESDKSVTQSNDTDATEIKSPTRCDITVCGSPAQEHVEHPQRGPMDVCSYHAREIDALPTWRFIGDGVA